MKSRHKNVLPSNDKNQFSLFCVFGQPFFVVVVGLHGKTLFAKIHNYYSIKFIGQNVDENELNFNRALVTFVIAVSVENGSSR